MNTSDFCKDFQWKTSDGGSHIITPWRYDDGDHVVIYVTRHGRLWRLDDNGEAAFRLAGAGVDVDADRVQARASSLKHLLGVEWDSDEEQFSITVDSEEKIRQAALAVAEAAVQMMALAALRTERQSSDFRERVIGIVEEVASSANIESRRNVPVDESGTLTVDLYLASQRPLMFIAATTPSRLMEAEIIWLDATRRGEDAYVLVAIENVRKVGLAQYTRANYYTDKTVEFTTPTALTDLIVRQIAH